MAITKIAIDGYGQLEINNCAFRRNGRNEAQCALDGTDFATAVAENGMILAVDKANKVIKFPTTGERLPVAINYSTEKMYDPLNQGLKNFYSELGGVYPRLGYLEKADTFTTNCICADIGAGPAEFANEAAVFAALADYASTPVYGTYLTGTAGRWYVTGVDPITAGEQVLLKVIDYTTMPDGTFGVKFQVM